MTGARRWGDHIRDKLVVSCGTLRLENTHSFLGIESCILAALAEVDEVSGGVIEKAVRIRLDLEVLNEPETLTLEDPYMPIEA